MNFHPTAGDGERIDAPSLEGLVDRFFGIRDRLKPPLAAEWHMNRETFEHCRERCGIRGSDPSPVPHRRFGGVPLVFGSHIPFGYAYGTDPGWPHRPGSRIRVVLGPEPEAPEG